MCKTFVAMDFTTINNFFCSLCLTKNFTNKMKISNIYYVRKERVRKRATTLQYRKKM